MASSLYCFVNMYIKIMTSFNLCRSLSGDVLEKCRKVVHVVPDFVCCSCWFLFKKCIGGYILFSWFPYGVIWGAHLVVLLVIPTLAECLLKVFFYMVLLLLCYEFSTYIFVHLMLFTVVVWYKKNKSIYKKHRENILPKKVSQIRQEHKVPFH